MRGLLAQMALDVLGQYTMLALLTHDHSLLGEVDERLHGAWDTRHFSEYNIYNNITQQIERVQT